MAQQKYGINFKSREARTHRNPNRLVYGFDDATFDALAKLFKDNITDGSLTSMKCTSLTKYILNQHQRTTHPEGTRHSLRMYLVDGDGVVQKVLLRNIKATVTAADLRTTFVGNVGVQGGGVVTQVSGDLKDLPGAAG